MADRKGFMRSLVNSGLTREQILDAMEKAEKRGAFTPKQPVIEETPAEPVVEEKMGYLQGINKAMDERALSGAMVNLEKEKYPMEHAVKNINTLFAIPMEGASKALDPVKPIFKKAGKMFVEGLAIACLLYTSPSPRD